MRRSILNEIAAAANLPHAQMGAALVFLDERGLIAVRHRRSYLANASAGVFCGMIQIDCANRGKSWRSLTRQ